MKYYKVLRSDMTHHGFVYKEGLNIDTEPFDETPDCGGGLFFSNAENILSFVNYGNLIAEVEVPNGEKIIQVENKYKVHSIVLKNIKPIWTVDTFKYFIEEGIDIHANHDNAFQYAGETGNLELVKFLGDNGANIHMYSDYVFRFAAENGYLDMVKYLVSKGANIYAHNDWALRYSAGNGHLEVVQYLIDQGADSHTGYDLPFLIAAENGRLNIVKYLVGHGVNIHAADDYAFQYGTAEVITYLNSLNK